MLVLGGHLACLGDGDTEGTGCLGMLFEDLPSEVGILGRGGVDGGTVGVDDGLPEWLGHETSLDHEDGGLDVEKVGDHGEGGTPLSRTGLGGQGMDAGIGVVIRLCKGGVPLVGAERTHVLSFEIDLRRGLEILLEPVCPLEGGRSVQRDQRIPDLLGDVDVLLLGELLFDYVVAEDCFEILFLHRLFGDRMDHGLQVGQVCRDVIPSLGDALGRQLNSCIFWNCHERKIAYVYINYCTIVHLFVHSIFMPAFTVPPPPLYL